jgi:hypothetical protein
MHPVPTRGAFRDRHAGSGGRGSAKDESADCGRRSRVVLTPRRWRSSLVEQAPSAMVATKPGHQGEREGNR